MAKQTQKNVIQEGVNVKMLIMSFPQVYGYDVVEKVGVGSFSVVYKAIKKVGTIHVTWMLTC